MTDLADIINNNKSCNKDKIKKNKEDNNIEKNKGGRISKGKKYANERKEILNKLLNILGINETNKILYFDELEDNKEKQEQILGLVNDIRRYYVCGKWSYFAKKNIPKPYISIVKSILKYEGVKYDFQSLKDGKTQRTIRQSLKFH